MSLKKERQELLEKKEEKYGYKEKSDAGLFFHNNCSCGWNKSALFSFSACAGRKPKSRALYYTCGGQHAQRVVPPLSLAVCSDWNARVFSTLWTLYHRGAEITDVIYPSIEVPNSEIIASVYIIDEYGDEGRVSKKKEYTKLHDAAGNTLTDADLAAGQKIEMVVLNTVIYEPVQTFYDCQEITVLE